ncbi:MAG: glycine cleavage system protein GcvH [candidate division WS1 bacterium]|jgi:glycine cleavage system H protein|nr:glycine cleavage system protein GcvH [candidate division WS1 bacterium]
MDFPEDRKYAQTHEWAKAEGDVVRVGLTSFALEQLGDIIYLDLPEEGTAVEQGVPFGEIESVKAVGELISPVTGEITEVNEAMMDDLDALADDPWEAGWLLVIAPADLSQLDGLMDAAAYAEHCEKEA